MIVFFGSSEYSISVLKTLLERKRKILVITSPDRPAGRGQKPTPTPVALLAQKNSLPIFKPENLNQVSPEKIIKNKPEVGLCCAYGKIIPPSWLNFFPQGILNIHPSLLPRYRGPAPVQFALLNQEKETGVTVIKMDQELDHGPIIWQTKEKIRPEDTAQTLYQRLFQLAARQINQVINDYLAGKITPRPQNHSQATFTRHLTREDGFIPPEKIFTPHVPEEVDRKRRAFTPWPGIFTRIVIKKKEKILKIITTHQEKGRTVIDQVQLEGKKPVSFSQFCSAYSFSFS